MKRFLLVLAALLIVTAVAFSGGRREATDGARLVTLATDATWPPMEFVDENRQVVGYDIDLMRAVAEAAGFQVEFRNTAWDGIFAGLANGDYDAVISSVTITDERKATMDFSIPYINAGQVLIVAQATSGVTTLSDLVGKRVGAQIGTTGAFEIEAVAGVTLVTYDELGLAIADLANGRIDGVVADTPIAADYVLQSAEYSGRLKIVGEPFTDEYYGIAVRRGNSELLALMNKGLEAVLASDLPRQLEDKWLR